MTEQEWDARYAASERAPWDIGRPQPAFVRLADGGLLRGPLLDAGCGSGEHTLLAAARGVEAMGIDISPHAIEQARAKAAEREVAATFMVGDALDLGTAPGRTFSTVTDSGLFHVFDDEARVRYVASLAAAVAPGGNCYLMCFSDLQGGDFGPRRVRQDELRAAFSDGWTVTSITAAVFEVNPEVGPEFGGDGARAWLAAIRRG